MTTRLGSSVVQTAFRLKRAATGPLLSGDIGVMQTSSTTEISNRWRISRNLAINDMPIIELFVLALVNRDQ